VAKDQVQTKKSIIKTTTYTAFGGDYVRCNTASGSFTVTLPNATLNENRTIIIKKVSADGYIVTVNTTSSQTIDSTTKVTSLTLPTQSASITVTSNGTSWDLITKGTIVDADVNASAAIDGYKISTNFGSQDITTTGIINLGNITATDGYIRFPSANLTMYARNNANTANVQFYGFENANNQSNWVIRGFGLPSLYLSSSGDVINFLDSTGTTVISSITTDITGPNYNVYENNNFFILQRFRSTNNPTSNITVKAQDGYSLATGSNLDGGNIILLGGARGATSGRKGYFLLSLNGTISEQMVACVEVSVESTNPSIVLWLFTSTGVDGTKMPTGTGNKVIYLLQCAVAPTTNPNNGSIIYSEDGYTKYRSSSGTISALGNFIVKTKTTTYTAIATDFVRCDTSAGGFTVTLPDAIINSNNQIIIKKISSDNNILTINTTNSQLIDSSTSDTNIIISTKGTSFTFASNSVSWDII
jgi:hypothetical protein